MQAHYFCTDYEFCLLQYLKIDKLKYSQIYRDCYIFNTFGFYIKYINISGCDY